MNLFRSEEHVTRWLDGRRPGATLDVTTLNDLAHDWWGDRLHPDWQPHTRQQNQAILINLGLTDDFWRPRDHPHACGSGRRSGAVSGVAQASRLSCGRWVCRCHLGTIEPQPRSAPAGVPQTPPSTPCVSAATVVPARRRIWAQMSSTAIGRAQP